MQMMFLFFSLLLLVSFIIQIKRVSWIMLIFLWLMLLLFLLCGAGNGSTFHMIVAAFEQRRVQILGKVGAADEGRMLAESRTQAAAALGFAGAVGAYGGFFIPKMLGSSVAMTGLSARRSATPPAAAAPSPPPSS